MAIARLGAIGLKQPIPDREKEAEIGVVLVLVDRVVNPVHVRCDNDLPHNPVEPERQSCVGMIEHRAAIEDDLECDHCDGCWSQ